MSQANALEQYMLELLNAERKKAGAQPLAFDGDLNEAADSHSRWMINADVFSHTGSGGSSATDRMKAAGYAFMGSWSAAENIAWASLRTPAGLKDEVNLLHENLMDSPGHRANILNGTFREVGVGFQTGDYEGWQSAFVTQNFAKSGSSLFLTGAAIADKDKDRFYDPGEGLGGLNVRAVKSTGETFSAKTGNAGGYDIALPSGTYAVTFSGGGFTPVSKQVTIGSKSVKLDWIDSILVGGTASSSTITGTAAANTLNGTAKADVVKGLGGNDKLYGRGGSDKIYGGSGHDLISDAAGNDRLYGEAGRDKLNGGAGNDVLSGGKDTDTFRFSGSWGYDRILDFTDKVDRIDLRSTDLTFGQLSIARRDLDKDGRADDVLIQADGSSIGLLNFKAALLGSSDFLL